MRTASFLPLAFALAASAFDFSDISIGADTVCGDNAVDCNNGYCCSSGQTCDTTGDVTKCGNDPAKPFSLGAAADDLGDRIDSALNAIPTDFIGKVESFATALPSSLAGQWESLFSNEILPTGSALESFINAVPTELRSGASEIAAQFTNLDNLQTALDGGPANTGTPQSGNGEGAAVRVGAATFGNTAALMAGIWGVAALGGAGLLFL